jgi:DNA ligase (NAD+)
MTEPTKVASTVARLLELDDAYFNGDALVSDTDYDELKNWLRTTDPTNEYFKRVGADVRTGKEPLPVTMGSLNQLYDDNDLSLWVKKYELQNRFCILTEKLDGFSCLLVYTDGNLTQAFSRGNGIEGASVIRHVQHINSVPPTIPISGTQYIRGEIIMKPSVFQEKYSTQYKNPRNMTAGCMNRTTTESSVLNDLDFIAHEWVMYEDTKQFSLVALEGFAFLVPNTEVMVGDRLTRDLLERTIKEFKKRSEYELDGVVITIDDLDCVQNVSKSSSLNPEHSIKFKLQGEGIQTEVVKVHWESSKNFLMKPRIEIKPIQLGGVTITFATGFNAKFIVENNIGPGAVVLITRQGDVIPYCKAVLKGTQPDLPTDVEYEWNETKVEIALKDKNTPEVIFKQVLDFFVSLEVELLKEANLRSLFDAFSLDGREYTDIIGVIFDLTEIEFERVIGSNGKKIYSSLHRRLQNTNLPTLMGSLNYCGAGFGVRKATALLEQISVDQITSVEVIAHLNGFDEKSARNIFAGVEKFREFLTRFDEYIALKQEEPKEDKLSALVVVMTGFRDKDLHAKIESLGGKVGSSVSGKTTHLLTLDPNTLTGKTKAAKDKGVTIMSPDQFKEAFSL